jgi:hypothetical protein
MDVTGGTEKRAGTGGTWQGAGKEGRLPMAQGEIGDTI